LLSEPEQHLFSVLCSKGNFWLNITIKYPSVSMALMLWYTVMFFSRGRFLDHMTGTSDRGSIMEDWMAMPPTPSPRTLMSNFLNEDFSSGPFSNLFGEHGSNKPQDESEKPGELVDLREQVPAQSAKATPQKDFTLQPNFFNANQKSNPHGGLAERMASRAGFSIPKIDTSRVGSSTVVRSPISIPPGLSPNTLLESPVFLFNNMVCHLLITRLLI
jgi:WRKY transcription factor 2